MGWIMFVTNMDGRTIRCSDNCGNTVVCRDTSCLPSTSINVRYRPKALSPVLDRVPGTRTGTLKAPPSLSFTLSAHLAVFTRANAREVNIHTHTHGSRIRRHPSVPLLYLYSRACHFHFGASLMGLPPPPPFLATFSPGIRVLLTLNDSAIFPITYSFLVVPSLEKWYYEE